MKWLHKFLSLFGDVILDVAGEIAEKKGFSKNGIKASRAAIKMLQSLAENDENNLSQESVEVIIDELAKDGTRQPIDRYSIKVMGKF
jgi:hypothetical protein